jgi:multidrug efflux pump subunit AcrB
VVQAFLVEPQERTRTQQQIFESLPALYRRFSAARIIPSQEPTIATSLAAGRQLPVQFVVQNLDFGKLQEALPKFLDAARADSTFGNVDMNLKFNKPELNITIDRLKATDLGINVSDVSNTLQYALSGRRYDYFLRGDKQYMVIGQVDRSQRDKPADISSLYVRNQSGELVQLDNLVTVAESSSPPTLYHYNRFKSATVSATLAPGRTLGEGIAAMRRIGKKLLDDSFSTALAGESRDFAESGSNIYFGLILALLLVYLILAAQFESFREPLIIMLTVPLAIAGALLSLWLLGQTLNIFSKIAMIMLIGIVTKNGILIVEFSNQKRAAGLDRTTAALEGATTRLRPILMTSIATVFGAMPIALGIGAGSESRMPLGTVVVGGILFSLILTLYVIPSMYSLMAKKRPPMSLRQTAQPPSPETAR